MRDLGMHSNHACDTVTAAALSRAPDGRSADRRPRSDRNRTAVRPEPGCGPIGSWSDFGRNPIGSWSNSGRNRGRNHGRDCDRDWAGLRPQSGRNSIVIRPDTESSAPLAAVIWSDSGRIMVGIRPQSDRNSTAVWPNLVSGWSPGGSRPDCGRNRPQLRP